LIYIEEPAEEAVGLEEEYENSDETNDLTDEEEIILSIFTEDFVMKRF
jgi:hypothetical protein